MAAQLTTLAWIFSAKVVFGGKPLSVTGVWMAPIMATIYVIMVAIICLMNLSQFGSVLLQARSPSAFRPGHGRWLMAASSSPRDDPRDQARPSPTRLAVAAPINAAATPRPCRTRCAVASSSPCCLIDTHRVVSPAIAFASVLRVPEVEARRDPRR